MLEVEFCLRRVSQTVSLSLDLRVCMDQGGAYDTSAVSNGPSETLAGANFGFGGDEGDKLDLCVFWTKTGIADGAVLVGWEGLGVDGSHLGFGDQVEGLLDTEDGDCRC